VRFEVLIAVAIKITVFWIVTLSNLIGDSVQYAASIFRAEDEISN
jgi:hypothetical protein